MAVLESFNNLHHTCYDKSLVGGRKQLLRRVCEKLDLNARGSSSAGPAQHASGLTCVLASNFSASPHVLVTVKLVPELRVAAVQRGHALLWIRIRDDLVSTILF